MTTNLHEKKTSEIQIFDESIIWYPNIFGWMILLHTNNISLQINININIAQLAEINSRI